MREIDDQKGTAAYLGKTPRALEQWRYRGEGPPYIKIGQAVRYRRADVDRWLDENTVYPAKAEQED